jgi:hypothetical protein
MVHISKACVKALRFSFAKFGCLYTVFMHMQARVHTMHFVVLCVGATWYNFDSMSTSMHINTHACILAHMHTYTRTHKHT